MQSNIKSGFENYAEVMGKLKRVKNNSGRREYLETKLFEIRDAITNQKPVIKSLLFAFPSEREKIYDLILSPLNNLQEFLEDKISLMGEFHSYKTQKPLANANHSTEVVFNNAALDELKAYIDRTVGKSIHNIPEPCIGVSDVLLKRSDVAKLFSVSYVTISEWSKSGFLKSYHINSRVFFKKVEVMAAMKERGKRA